MAEIRNALNGHHDHDQDPTTLVTVMPKVITAVASLLQRVSESNDLSGPFHHHQTISPFHGVTKPTISVQSYLERIFTYANCSVSCYVVAYIYLDRFVKRHPFLPINSLNVHRLLVTSVLVSAKFMDDMFYNNAYYAKIGGISTDEMNMLEVDFLFGLGFELNVTPSTFDTYCSCLQREILMQSLVLQPSRTIGRRQSMSLYCCLGEEESSHPKQLAAV